MPQFRPAGISEAQRFWETLDYWLALLWRGIHLLLEGRFRVISLARLKLSFSFVLDLESRA
jgi:hypothetical protein